MKSFYYGGQKSGKSNLASIKALSLSRTKPYYLATYDNSYNDEAMHERIYKHIKERENDFLTLEEAYDLNAVIKEGNTYLIDCMTMWIFNNMDKKEDYLIKELKKLFLLPCNIVFILNDVGSGVIPLDKQSRDFVDLSGIIGQFLAKNCDEVIEVKYGIEKKIK
ncbi:MAG: bifunctional adenosylcobinamide kinase/adenosylcobinamide-phosphate guanylyltransferase [Campylobacteraceae bacterium]|nr:bifunctional adenosylcobinamide kinase/adenosylcobinamide-phosphate guanylyltransferase [Campylobacteraceae bacterium]